MQEHEHQHVTFTPVSLIGTTMCDLCGAVVASPGQSLHEIFHGAVLVDSGEQLELALGGD
jgi:hypothetical protein